MGPYSLAPSKLENSHYVIIVYTYYKVFLRRRSDAG